MLAIKKVNSATVKFLARTLSRKELRPVVREMTRLHVWLYRRTGGKAQFPKFPTMLLTTTGRKTGKPRTIPVVYVTDGGRYIIAAAYAGSAQDPTWWLNLQQNPVAELEVLRQKIKVRATQAGFDERERLWRKLAGMYPPFTEYQSRTQRQIPVIVLEPV